MSLSTSARLRNNKQKIMDMWVKRALEEVPAAQHQEDLALRNSLPIYLDQMIDALSKTINRTDARKLADKTESTRIGKKHGRERAASFNYSMDQVIFEYHIMRQIICDVLEEEVPLTSVEREIIVCSVEQAVNDAATEFSDTLRDVQDHLTQTLAHDFRTPLHVAKLNLQLIMRRPEDIENILSKASRASVSLDRLEGMIQDLLDASRMKAGNDLNLTFSKDCDLNWIIKEVAGDLNLSYENQIIVESSGSCLGNWNEKGLRRVVENLTTNAIKYGKAKTPVTITLAQTPESASLSVHNEGNPIPSEEVSMLFEKFRRSRSAKEQMGWGLGLTVVKGMTEEHKGQIEVTSSEENGTTFTIELPRDPEKA